MIWLNTITLGKIILKGFAEVIMKLFMRLKDQLMLLCVEYNSVQMSSSFRSIRKQCKYMKYVNALNGKIF